MIPYPFRLTGTTGPVGMQTCETGVRSFEAVFMNVADGEAFQSEDYKKRSESISRFKHVHIETRIVFVKNSVGHMLQAISNRKTPAQIKI